MLVCIVQYIWRAFFGGLCIIVLRAKFNLLAIKDMYILSFTKKHLYVWYKYRVHTYIPSKYTISEKYIQDMYIHIYIYSSQPNPFLNPGLIYIHTIRKKKERKKRGDTFKGPKQPDHRPESQPHCSQQYILPEQGKWHYETNQRQHRRSAKKNRPR